MGVPPFLAEIGARLYGVPDRVRGYVVSVYVLISAYKRTRIIFIDKYFRKCEIHGRSYAQIIQF